MNVEKIPAAISKRICQMMAAVHAIPKTQYNKHGGYKFAGVDDIYAATTRKLGEIGLTILPLEVDFEIVRVGSEGKTAQWLRAVYQFVFAAEEETWTDKTCRRSVFLQVLGPQSIEGASSYAQKAFMRSVFKLPTGDADPDSMPQAETEEDQTALAQPKKRKSSSAAKKDGETPALFNEIRKAISEAISKEMLMHVRETYAEELATLPVKWSELLSEDYEDKMQSFNAFRDAAE